MSVSRWKAAAAFAVPLLAMAGSLASEQVTISTIYPAPSGVYTRMITTGATFLARDGGSSVVIGGTGPAGARLDVIGDIRASTDIRALGTLRGASIRATAGAVTASGDVCTDMAGGKCLSTMGTSYPACNNIPDAATNKPCRAPLYRCPNTQSANGVSSGPWASYGCWGQLSVNYFCQVTVFPQTQNHACGQIGTFLVL